MILETARLILRPWRESDAEDLFTYAADPRVGPAAGWPPHSSIENSRQVIRSILSEPETYAVVVKETGHAVGSIGIMFAGRGNTSMTETEAEIGYWIGVPFWGRGLIPEAVREMQRRCFTDLHRTGLWCGYYDGNDRSRRVQEKCGFTFHHTVQKVLSPIGDIRTEHFTYLSREEWMRTHSAAP